MYAISNSFRLRIEHGLSYVNRATTTHGVRIGHIAEVEQLEHSAQVTTHMSSSRPMMTSIHLRNRAVPHHHIIFLCVR